MVGAASVSVLRADRVNGVRNPCLISVKQGGVAASFRSRCEVRFQLSLRGSAAAHWHFNQKREAHRPSCPKRHAEIIFANCAALPRLICGRFWTEAADPGSSGYMLVIGTGKVGSRYANASKICSHLMASQHTILRYRGVCFLLCSVVLKPAKGTRF